MHPASTPAIPARLGEFVLVGVLGEGGSGIVYDARWGHREVALKVLHPLLVATPKEREQFLVEARRLAEIHHAGVVKVLGVGELADGRPFLAMEKLRGETLAARVARGPLPIGDALELFAQLCDAVEAFHQRGLVHRDLKPENVMLVAGVDGRQHAVLLDFGIAKDLGSAPSTTTQDGGVRGTPAYMAPERFFGQPASVSTDVYELAVTLFAMLAGRLPWSDHADPEVRLDPKRLAEVAPHVPAPLDTEVRRALSTRAQVRPASAAELRTAVMSAAGLSWIPRSTVDVKSGPVPVPGPAPAPDPTRNLLGLAPTTAVSPRKRGRVILAFVLVAMAATGIGVAAHYLSRPSEAAAKQVTVPAVDAAPESGRGPGTGSGSEITEVRGPATDLVATLAHLPDDEQFALGVQVAQLQNDAVLAPLLTYVVESRPAQMFRIEANLGSCELDLRALADWVVIGGPAEETAVDLIASGRWTRAELERCLATSLAATATTPNGRLTTFTGGTADRTIGWIDDRTFVLSSRDAADAAWIEQRLADTTPLAGALAGTLAEVQLAAPVWVAGNDAGFERTKLSDGTDFTGLWGALTADPRNVGLDLHIRYKDAKAAAAARKDLQTQVGTLGMDESIGRIVIESDPRRPDVLHVEMSFTRMVAGMLIEATKSMDLSDLAGP